MSKKLIISTIIGLLILTTSTYTISAETNNYKSKNNQDGFISESFYNDELIQKKIFEREASFGDFDMFLEGLAWWSPTEDEENNIICYNFLIDYTGLYDNENDYQLTLNIWANYEENKELLVTKLTNFGKVYSPWSCLIGSKPRAEKPISLTFEFETDYPEEPIENNKKTITFDLDGITVQGFVKTQTNLGDKIPIKSTISCYADENHFYDEFFATRTMGYDGFYDLHAPYIPGHIYSIVANFAGVKKTYNIDYAEEFEIYEVDFLFFGQPPEKPIINGPSNGNIGKNIEFTIKSSDPDGDDINYYIHWGCFGDEEEFIGTFKSGEEVKVDHRWFTKGDYNIVVYTQDNTGYKSDYEEFRLSMAKNRVYNSPLLRFLENHQRLLPLLRNLIKLFI